MASNLDIHARHNADTRRVPPAHVLDKIAERAITGGYKIGKANRCALHNVARSVNGTCFLRE